MAKVSFNKLGLNKSDNVCNIFWNEQKIEVKQYLPIQKKLELLSNVINKVVDSNKFYNPGQLDLFFKLEVIQQYTNISFTEKQKEDFCKTFDLLESSGLIEIIFDAGIPHSELDSLKDWLITSIQAIYTYNNSARAILESLQEDYNNLDFDIEALQEKIKDPESLNILKEVVPFAMAQD